MQDNSSDITETKRLHFFKWTRRNTSFDYSLLFVIVFLLCFGLIMLYSTSSFNAQRNFGDSLWFLKKQIFAVIVGMAAMIFTASLDYHLFKIKYMVWVMYIVTVITILLTQTGLGTDNKGASRWLNLGGISFQPAELAKVVTIIATAYLIDKYFKSMKKAKSIIVVLMRVPLLFVLLLYLVTNNLSSAIIVMAIAIVQLFVASPKWKPFIILVVIIAAVVTVVVFLATSGFIESFRGSRILVWFNPEEYSSEAGYQVVQGLWAIGSGGLTGKGLGQSIQKLGYVPEAQNDMIFSIICEELGLIGALAIIFIFGFMIWRFMDIATHSQDIFGTMIVVGIMAHIAIQVILNIAVVTNSMPNTGVTLPFISYGGTSVVFLMAEMGLALSISARIRKGVYAEDIRKEQVRQ